MIHPAHETKEPPSDPDYASFSEELWFTENVYSIKRSDGKWEVCPLLVCPMTGLLMYMPHSYPICWYHIKDEKINEAHMRYLVEKELLGVFSENG